MIRHSKKEWWQQSPEDCLICNHVSKIFIENEILDGLDGYKTAEDFKVPSKVLIHHVEHHMDQEELFEARRTGRGCKPQ